MFGFIFNHGVHKLPEKLSHITFGHSFASDIDRLPDSVQCITFPIERNINPITITKFPKGTLNLKLIVYLINFNIALTHLSLGNSIDIKVNDFPSELAYLRTNWYLSYFL